MSSPGGLSGGGYEGLSQQLFSAPFALRVTPRRRLFATLNQLVAANSNSTFNLTTPPTADLLVPSGALLIELLMLQASAAAAGCTITSVQIALSFFLNGLLQASGIPLPGQPVFTLSTFSAGNNFIGLLTPQPNLLTSHDIKFFASAGGQGPVIPPQNPAPSISATVANSTAGAISVTLNLFAFVRVIEGLQEG